MAAVGNTVSSVVGWLVAVAVVIPLDAMASTLYTPSAPTTAAVFRPSQTTFGDCHWPLSVRMTVPPGLLTLTVQEVSS